MLQFVQSFAGDSYLTEGGILNFHIKMTKEVVNGDLTVFE
jgi:hypothetical protein